MKFKATSYHFNLLKDYSRLAIFKEAIDEVSKDLIYSKKNFKDSKSSNVFKDSELLTTFDLGCGSGILSYFASNYADNVIAIDKDNKIVELTKENLKDFENIKIYCEDILNFDFKHKADLIICEMLDTALIDEEEVPVLNYARRFLKNEGKIIPQSIINIAEPIFMKNHYLQYEDDDSQPIYDIIGDSVKFSEFNFADEIVPDFSTIIEFKVNKFNKLLNEDENNNFLMNGIKLTSFTKLSKNTVCGPTPMLNPSILVPINDVNVSIGDTVTIQLSYVMGKGIETIKTKIIE